MKSELKRRETLARGVRRILCDRTGKALACLGGGDQGRISDAAVHEARTCFKQARALLRLVRHDLGGRRFDRGNRALRDAGRPLSQARDARVLIETLDELATRGRIAGRTLAQLRAALAARRRRIRRGTPADSRLMNSVRREIGSCAQRLERVALAHRGWKALHRGLHRTYGDGRVALAAALRAGTDEHWHELRKRAKDLRHDIEFLGRMRPAPLRSMAKAAHRFTDLLGKDHDLAVLQAFIAGRLQHASGRARPLQSLISRRRARLQRNAGRLGRKLYRPSAGEFLRRMHHYWKRW